MSSRTLKILLTGGTGSFGCAFVRRQLASKSPSTIRIYSRDELKQYEMARTFQDDARLRFFVGDVRDERRLHRAMHGVDLVIHAAAMKQVPICEFNPAEAVKTNIQGAQNVVDCAIDAGVRRTIGLSTDKAVNPVNLYGATKLCAEKLLVHGNVYSGGRRSGFSCVRYGNVVGSRGSVVPLFREQAKSGVLTVTDLRMTRFWLSLDHAVRFVMMAVREMKGGEIFIPKIPSMRIVDLARAIAPEAEIREIGMRPGEKLHEVLLTAEEAVMTREFPSHFVLRRGKQKGGRALAKDVVYASETNTEWISVGRLRELIGDFEAPHASPDEVEVPQAEDAASQAKRKPRASVPPLGVARFAG